MSFVKQENPGYYMDSKDVSSSNIGDGQHHGEYNQQGTQASQNPITAFLAKLWALVNDPSCDDLIAWDPSGGSFHVYDQARFAREILPRYFKHNNFASFIRQLNMYGFRKMSTIEHGSLQNERDDIEFAHPHFIRGQDSLLELIKRRAPDNQQKSTIQGGNSSSALVSRSYLDSKTGLPVQLVQLLDDVRNLQAKQTSLSDKLSYMQTENEALWSEIGSLRQKHSKQQQIVSKLMEFLVHFISTNSANHQEHSVEQQPSNEDITTDLFNPQKTQTQHHTNNSPIILNEQNLSPNTLKRKHAALMHSDEPNKRTTMQQQQKQQFSHPSNLGRQQSVTINELTDSDAGRWLHTTDTSPLVDLVPSPPPPPTQNIDDNYPQQQQNDYRWQTATNELLNPIGHDQRNLSQQNQTIQTVGNGDNVANTYIPDFILRTDNSSGTNMNIGQTDGANLTGIRPSHTNQIKQVPISTLLKQEQIEFPKTFQQNPHHPHGEIKPSETLYSQNQQQYKIGQPSEQISFSLDDITGDVDHIQSSLDNIRELMFDHLPDEPSIEDLFGEDNGFLSPLLQSTSNNNPTGNLLLETLQDQKSSLGDHQSEQIDSTKTSQSVPDVNNQLLEQLITEAAIVEEQRNTINQLARDKSNLEDKIHLLEQQTTQRK